MSIQAFMQNATKLARANLFRVLITPPAALGQQVSREILFNCSNASFPSLIMDVGMTKQTPELPHEFAIRKSYPIQSMTFYASEDHRERKFFAKWFDLISPDENDLLEYYDNYVGQAVITQLNRKLEETHTVTLERIFPKQVGPIEFNYNNNDQIAQFMVEFSVFRSREGGQTTGGTFPTASQQSTLPGGLFQ